MKVQFSGKARSDLVRAYRYLAERNPVVAEKFMADVDLKLDQLSRFPRIGRDRS
jgi:plasmid stabilization system protein ParE